MWEELEQAGIKPYFKDDSTFLVNADCRDILPLIPKDMVSLVLTDPPYGIDYAAHPIVGKNKSASNHAPMNWDVSPADNIGEIIKLASYSIVWGGNYYNLPLTRCWLVWYKPDAPPSIGDCELAWTNLSRPNQLLPQTIAATNGERRGHPTQKPLKLLTWCITQADKCGTNNLILDPFLGSGTTAVAAKILGRKCIGIEIEEKYCKIAVERLRQSVMRLDC